VLLTDALAAKVTGFGLLGMAASASGSGSDATPAKGAAGYVDPEYLSTYQLTDKSDVYSFGVLVVELVTGRPPVERSRGGEARLTTKWVRNESRILHSAELRDAHNHAVPCHAGAAEVQRRGSRGGHGPQDAAEPGVGGGRGEDAGAGGATARKDRPSMRRCTEVLWAIRREYHRREEPRCAAVADDRSDEWVLR